jgi:fatty acid desaturase
MHPDPHHPAPTAHAHNIHAPAPAEDERRDDLPGTGLAWGLVVYAAIIVLGVVIGSALWWVMPL